MAYDPSWASRGAFGRQHHPQEERAVLRQKLAQAAPPLGDGPYTAAAVAVPGLVGDGYAVPQHRRRVVGVAHLNEQLAQPDAAVQPHHPARRVVGLYCGIRLGKLLIEVRNPYDTPPVLRDGIPVSDEAGHGYGCRSIRAIAQRRGGLCQFLAEDGTFLLRVMLPAKSTA